MDVHKQFTMQSFESSLISENRHLFHDGQCPITTNSNSVAYVFHLQPFEIFNYLLFEVSKIIDEQNLCLLPAILDFDWYDGSGQARHV